MSALALAFLAGAAGGAVGAGLAVRMWIAYARTRPAPRIILPPNFFTPPINDRARPPRPQTPRSDPRLEGRLAP